MSRPTIRRTYRPPISTHGRRRSSASRTGLRAATGKSFARYPRWSPDGKKVAFASDRGGSYEIWTMDADGTNLRQLTFNSPPNTSFPVWSPDGTRLLYRRSGVHLILDLRKGFDEQTPEQLPWHENPQDYFVVWDWSPDGKKLAGTLEGMSGRGVGYYSFQTGHYEKVADIHALGR